MIAHTLSDGRVLRIATHFEYPPIPIRDFDWSAVDDLTYDGPGNNIGHGKTEEAAIADLIEEFENDI